MQVHALLFPAVCCTVPKSYFFFLLSLKREYINIYIQIYSVDWKPARCYGEKYLTQKLELVVVVGGCSR